MSSRQRKRHGGAVDSTQAQKRSRLLPSSAGGTSQTEPTELEECGRVSSEPVGDELCSKGLEVLLKHLNVCSDEQAVNAAATVDSGKLSLESPKLEEDMEILSLSVPHPSREHVQHADKKVIDLTDESSEPELIIDLTGESSESEVITLSDDESAVDREQNQQHSKVSGAGENSAEPLASGNEEEARDNDDPGPSSAWPAGPANPPVREDDNSEVQDGEQSQQNPCCSRAAENSPELLASGNEEEPRENDGEWPAGPASPSTSETDNSEDWEQNPPYPRGSRASESSPEILACNLLQDPIDIEFEWPAGPASPSASETDNSELLEANEQPGRNVTPSSHEQPAGSVGSAGADDVPVAAPAPAGQAPAEEGTAHSNPQQGVVIRCPICMDFYSEIVKSGRLLVATLCGHVFCSRCLPVALETAGMCPSCRTELTPELYIPLYL